MFNTKKENNSETKSVLLVEDDKNFTEIISAKLKGLGVESLIASTVSDAWKILTENKIDLIWIDHYLLGEETGYDLTAKIKADPELKKVPVFVVSNYDDFGNPLEFMGKMGRENETKTYLEFGVDKYFVKSNTSLEEIFDQIKRYLKL